MTDNKQIATLINQARQRGAVITTHNDEEGRLEFLTITGTGHDVDRMGVLSAAEWLREWVKVTPVPAFNLVTFQTALVEKLIAIECHGVGDHKRRSRRGAFKAARAVLAAQGYTAAEAEQAIDDAADMAALELVAD